MNWKRTIVRASKVAIPCLGAVGVVLSIPAWPDRLRTLLAVVGMVDSETARWAVMVVSLAAIAYPVVYWRVSVWLERRRHKRFLNLGYLTACATVNAFTKFSTKSCGHLVDHAIIKKFEELCPEGAPEKAVYNGYLLNSWLRFNAAELLIKHRDELEGIPSPDEKPK